MLGKYLIFSVGNELFGMDIMQVREIKEVETPNAIPNAPHYMLGVIRSRGNVIPLFDLKDKFGLGANSIDQRKVIVVVKFPDRDVGALVDAVSDIMDIDDAQIRRDTTIHATDLYQGYIRGIFSNNQQMIIMLDVDQLFDPRVLPEGLRSTVTELPPSNGEHPHA